MNQNLSETIVALATAPGASAIAIIRLTGSKALTIAERIFSRPLKDRPSHSAVVGRILDLSGNTIDHAMALVMRAPKTYTGEEMVEFHCHGGSLITRKVIETCLGAGARAATPGEFTLRAFMNGKIDLAQAEAVQAMIAAKSSSAQENAQKHLEGALSKKVSGLQEELFGLAAILEAWIDFPEEGLEFASFEKVSGQLIQLAESIKAFSKTFHDGKILHEGLTLCLIGAPNVGKSSLMNALLKKERAIVTDIPGTTRDILEETLQLGDLTVKLLDTAGLRITEEVIEKEGIRRSKKAMNEADIILFVLDASRPLLQEEMTLMETLPKNKTVIVWNKIDSSNQIPPEKASPISAKEGTGLEALKNQILSLIWKEGPPSKDEVLISSLRHKEALDKAAVLIDSVASGLKEGLSPEFLTSDLKEALKELATIIGKDVTEEILSAIFSRFCIGK